MRRGPLLAALALAGAAAAAGAEPARAETLAIEGATLLTVSGGAIADGVLVVEDGKIAALGRRGEVPVPAGARIIDGRGRFVLPGIIDTHSHMGVYPWTIARGNGDGNEATDPATPDVRAEDSVLVDDPAFERARAGGVTTALVLPGSANLVGGEGVVLKLRPAPRLAAMRFEGAPRQLKMAFGENPKRVYGERDRAPSTRMGNLAVLRELFAQAREYRERRARPEGSYPRPAFDARLEALADALEGKLRLQVHCYTQSDLQGLMRLADEVGVRVASVHHALEAYKVAPDLAARGIGVCTWADWWGFKQEAWDGIPENAALCAKAGVTVSIHSDSSSGVQRLFLEAAKTVAAGMPEADALAAITLGPAKILGIDGRVGSLEVGKDADLAVFSKHPFDVYTRVEMTFVDGALVYDRAAAERTPPAAPAAPRAFALRGARILPVSGPPIERGTVVVEDGRIRAVGGPELATPPGFAAIDVSGKVIFPGLIDAGTEVGLIEVQSDDSLRENEGAGGPFVPHLRISDGVNPESETIRVARAQGVTTCLVSPGEGNAMGGLAAVIDLDGATVGAMTVEDPVGLAVTIGGRALGRGRGKGMGTRMELIAALRKKLVEARAYQQKLDRHAQELARWEERKARREAERKAREEEKAKEKAGEGDAEKAKPPGAPAPTPTPAPAPAPPPKAGAGEARARVDAGGSGEGDAEGAGDGGRRGRDDDDPGLPPSPPSRDLELEALLPVLKGELPVIVTCDREPDIRLALAFADEMGLRLILRRATSAWRVAPLLAERGVPVIYGPVTLQPDGFETLDAVYEAAARLRAAGVRFAFQTDTSHDVRRLRVEAGIACAYGLAPEDALRALTLDAARVLGIDDSHGSLEPGKIANLVVASGDPLQPRTRIERVYIRGREVDLASRQTRLRDRYAEIAK